MARFAAVFLLALALPASALAWGGSYPTGDALGTQLHVEVDDSIPVDPALPQTWATFFGSLVHGPELGTLTLDLVPPEVVHAHCGSGALACYRRGNSTIYASPDDQPNEPSAREVLIHEYGHHISNNRSNAPWNAEDWGTKRWATYEHVCTRAEDGQAYPGNEQFAYALNPGEAFAETYRVLNLVREGATSWAWNVVDPSFKPDAKALSLLEQDVLHPWSGPTTTRVRGAGRRLVVKTPLDGSFTATARGGRVLTLYLGGKPVRRGTTIRYTVCGERTLTLGVSRAPYVVDVTKP